jgi:hypothetical protein
MSKAHPAPPALDAVGASTRLIASVCAIDAKRSTAHVAAGSDSPLGKSSAF